MQPIADEFLPWLQQAIPLTEHMGIRKLEWRDEVLVFKLELAPLVNDKGTGFGGGVAGLATLLGWCYVTLLLDEHAKRCPVVVKESSNAFLAPITGDFEMHCRCLQPGGWQQFLQDFARKGRARLQLDIQAVQQQTAFTYTGTYVALGHTG